jgi:uncharacterized protein DUF4238
MTPKTHHYNPQVYLRQFVNPASKKELWEFDIRHGTAKLSTPKASGCEDFYHSFDRADGTRDDTSLEQSFHSLENRLPKLFETIRHNRPMSQETWLSLFLFAALQRARGPRALYSIQDGLSRVYEHAFEIMKHSPAFAASMSKATLDPEAVRKTKFKITADRGHTLLTLLATNADGSLVKTFNRMKWAFFVAPPQKYFFTSDDPVCCWADRDSTSPFRGAVGPANPDAEVTFPLSRRTCAFAAWKPRAVDLYTPASATQVDAINHRTAFNGWHFLYGSTKDPNILALVEQIAKARAPRAAPPPENQQKGKHSAMLRSRSTTSST